MRTIANKLKTLNQPNLLQAGQHWALAHMPLRGEVCDVLTGIKGRSMSAQTRTAITAAEQKLSEKGLRRYIVPSDLANITRLLQVCIRDHQVRGWPRPTRS